MKTDDDRFDRSELPTDELTVLYVRWRAGDPAAFQALYALCAQRGLVSWVTSGRDPDDVLHDALLALLERPLAFDAARALRPYLSRVARNHEANAARRRACAAHPASLEPEALAAVPANVDGAGFDDDTRAAVRVALARMKPPYRAVLILAEIEGLSYADIGARLGGKTEDAVRMLLHRARAQFRSLFVAARDAA